MNCEIISVGTELLLGQIANTDAQFISRELAALGVNVFFHTAVGDNGKRFGECLSRAYSRSDLIIITGGLGPTLDDLTKETIASSLNLDMVLYPNVKEKLAEYFKDREMTPNNLRQAYFPEGTYLIKNNNGTAPGGIINHKDKIVIFLPGPPKELIPMLNETVVPYIKRLSGEKIKSKVIKIFGLGESKVESMVMDLIKNQSNPTIAPLINDGDVTLRITAKGSDENELDSMIDGVEAKIKGILGDYVYGINDDTLHKVVVKMLIDRKLTLGTAESCTGGMLGSRITEIPGSSAIYKFGAVTYSNEAKVKILNVNQQTLDSFGAVSEQTAKEMAQGIIKVGNTDLGISITGIAGPGGGTEQKPVGLVYIALAYKDFLKCDKFLFNGNREKNRLLACKNALDMIRRFVTNLN